MFFYKYILVSILIFSLSIMPSKLFIEVIINIFAVSTNFQFGHFKLSIKFKNKSRLTLSIKL